MGDCGCEPGHAAALERRTLCALLAINSAMFLVEAVAGWWGQSTGLLADALDMLADAAVYGIALAVVGGSVRRQAAAATVSGALQIALGVGVLLEVARRFVYGSSPESVVMFGVGTIALLANVACLALLAKHRDGGVHMRASWIFSTNDVIANVGVMVSGLLVAIFGHRLPDLVIGALIAGVVVRGGVRILQEAGHARSATTVGG